MKNNKWSIYFFNFFAFFAISMVNTQMIPFLSKIGYDLMQRGMILAANAIVAIIGQLLFGYICDRNQCIKRFFFIAYIILLASSIGMFIIQENWFFYHLFTVALMAGMVKVIMGLDETWMLELDPDQYGNRRAAGALGLTLGSILAGYLVKEFSYISLVISLLAVSLLLGYYFKKTPEIKRKQTSRIQMNILKKLVQNKSYLLLVTIYLLVYMIGTADQYVVIDKMLQLGANNSQIGYKWALQSFMEVPLFLGATWILKKWKVQMLLLFGTFMYGVKFILYGISYQPWMIIATTLLQLVTLPIIMLTSKVLISEIAPKSLQASAQMFAMAIFIGVSGLITPLITSFLCKNIGYNNALYVVAGFAIVPFLLTIYYQFLRKRNQTIKADS